MYQVFEISVPAGIAATYVALVGDVTVFPAITLVCIGLVMGVIAGYLIAKSK